MKCLVLLLLFASIYTWNIDAAVHHLVSHAHAKSIGYCAAYVANAMQAGGLRFQRQPSAYMYHTNGIMRGMGFYLVPRGSPRKGDVYVQMNTRSHVHGHMAMYSGSQWVSDFFQASDQVYSRDAGERFYYRK